MQEIISPGSKASNAVIRRYAAELAAVLAVHEKHDQLEDLARMLGKYSAGSADLNILYSHSCHCKPVAMLLALQ